ncbi:hypothetical protein RJT34_16565 [Clitoria ternatea]|uniref:Uncharacterized protein n=1 Tax=Clitoria ternatea TaxID=43366 RepID=A0AAN9J7N4_CLITE
MSPEWKKIGVIESIVHFYRCPPRAFYLDDYWDKQEQVIYLTLWRNEFIFLKGLEIREPEEDTPLEEEQTYMAEAKNEDPKEDPNLSIKEK